MTIGDYSGPEWQHVHPPSWVTVITGERGYIEVLGPAPSEEARQAFVDELTAKGLEPRPDDTRIRRDGDAWVVDADPEPDWTDWWRWYCRICGAAGEEKTAAKRDEVAERHRDEECSSRDAPHIGDAEAGHLRHVWRY